MVRVIRRSDPRPSLTGFQEVAYAVDTPRNESGPMAQGASYEIDSPEGTRLAHGVRGVRRPAGRARGVRDFGGRLQGFRHPRGRAPDRGPAVFQTVRGGPSSLGHGP